MIEYICKNSTNIDSHFIFSSFVVHGIPNAHTSEKRKMKRCVVFKRCLWFSGDMADTQARSECRESPSNVRSGGELSFFISTSLVNINEISKVSSLEPYLEALPSLLAMIHLNSVDPGFFSSSWSQVNLIKSCSTICQIIYKKTNFEKVTLSRST